MGCGRPLKVSRPSTNFLSFLRRNVLVSNMGVSFVFVGKEPSHQFAIGQREHDSTNVLVWRLNMPVLIGRAPKFRDLIGRAPEFRVLIGRAL